MHDPPCSHVPPPRQAAQRIALVDAASWNHNIAQAPQDMCPGSLRFPASQVVDPKVLQSILGVNFYNLKFGLANFRKIAGEFFLMPNSDSKFIGLVFSRVSGPPENSRPKFTPKLVGIPLEFHFLEP